LIETEGVAVVDTAPTYVEFSLRAHATGATLVEAMDNALRFEPALRKELQTREMTPTDLAFSGVAIPSVTGKEAVISARLRFAASAFSSAEDGPRQFAALCDKIVALGATLSCAPEGPVLGVSDGAALEDAAVARATEKAYPAAKAAAQVMNGQIVAVDKVVVETVVWNNAPGATAPLPDIRRVACTGKVKVSYTFMPSQP
jgi:uncharacterized protein YggE